MAALRAENAALNRSLRDTGIRLDGALLALDRLDARFRVLSDALDARLPPSAVSCGQYQLANGTVAGRVEHTGLGAVRILSCGPGFQLVGGATVVCDADGAWTDGEGTWAGVDDLDSTPCSTARFAPCRLAPFTVVCPLRNAPFSIIVRVPC